MVQWIGLRRTDLTDTILAMREYRFAFDEIRWPEPSLLRYDGVWYASIDKRYSALRTATVYPCSGSVKLGGI